MRVRLRARRAVRSTAPECPALPSPRRAVATRLQPSPNRAGRPCAALCFDIRPVPRAIRKCFESYQILRRAGIQKRLGQELVEGRSFDYPLLERQCTKGDVNRDAARGLEQEHPRAVSEFRSVRNASGIRAAELFDIRRLLAEAGKDGEIHVPGEARLPPPLERQAADEQNSQPRSRQNDWTSFARRKRSRIPDSGKRRLLLYQPGRGSHRTCERRFERTVKRLDVVGHLDVAQLGASQCRQPGAGNTPPFRRTRAIRR